MLRCASGEKGGTRYAAYLPYAGEYLPDLAKYPDAHNLIESTKLVSTKQAPMAFHSIPQWGELLNSVGWEFLRIVGRKMYNEALDDVVVTFRGVAISDEGECVVILFLKNYMIV